MLKGIIVIIILALIIGGAYLLKVKKYQNKVSEMKIKDINVSTKKDGKYSGSCDVDLIAAKVDVYIKDGRIKEIELIEHRNGRGEKAEKIIESVKEKNSLNVDTISGATNSSKVILKAIEEALKE